MNDYQMMKLADHHRRDLLAEAERGRQAHGQPAAGGRSRRQTSRLHRSHLALLFGRVAFR
jgi:hypothetical protein